MDTRAERDSGRDASTDTRADIDSGPVGPAGWVPLPGLPAGCVVERAERPEVVFTPTWEPCGAGCERLVQDPRYVWAFDERVGVHDGERGYFEIVMAEIGDADGHRIVVLAGTQGPPLGAWRGPSLRDPGLCSLGSAAVSARSAALEVTVGFADFPRQAPIYHGSHAEIGRVTEPIHVLRDDILRGSNSIQRMAVSETTVAAELQPLGAVMVMEGSERRMLSGPESPVRGIPQNVHVVGNLVFWEDWGRSIQLAFGSLRQTEAIFFGVDGWDVLVSSVSGEAIAWTQGTPVGVDSTVELWTAPYVDTPGAIAPRRVRDLEILTDGLAGGGHYAVHLPDVVGFRIEVYDLSDGRKRAFRAPDGVALPGAPFYLSTAEMLVKGVSDGRGTLYRIQLASLPYEEE
jgi:hypothetical protein